MIELFKKIKSFLLMRLSRKTRGMSRVIFYQSNGISVNNYNEIKTSFYIKENLKIDNITSRFFYRGDEIDYELESACIDLYETFIRKIFLNRSDYYRYIKYIPICMMNAGLNSDCDLSKEQFQQFLEEPLEIKVLSQDSKSFEEVCSFLEKNKYKYMYAQDCHSLINSIQELLQTCKSNFIFFYKLLCQMKGTGDFCDDYYAISAEGRIVISAASNVFISLYSIFDILTKLAYELEHLKDCENNYPKLASSKKLFGDNKELKNLNREGTIFEKDRTILIVENLRNELVHNTVWEMNSKIYFHEKNGIIVDKTIYFPDFSEEGHLVAYRNRKRFFSRGIKLNEILPSIYFETLQKVMVTLRRMVNE